MKAQTGESMEVIDLVPQGLHLKKVLVPTDFSDGSKKAVQYALRFAEQFGCDIALLYVVEPTTPMIGAPLAVEACTDKDEFSIAEKDLAALAAEAQGSCSRAWEIITRNAPFYGLSPIFAS